MSVSQAVGITTLCDASQVVVIHFFDVFACHLVDQGIGHVLVLMDGSGYFYADALYFVLQVGPVTVDKMAVMLSQEGGQRDHGVTLEEMVFWPGFSGCWATQRPYRSNTLMVVAFFASMLICPEVGLGLTSNSELCDL